MGLVYGGLIPRASCFFYGYGSRYATNARTRGWPPGRVVPWGVIADFGNGFLLDRVEDQLTDVVSVPNMPTENVWGSWGGSEVGVNGEKPRVI